MMRFMVACMALLIATPSVSADELLFDQPWTSTFAAPESVFIPSLPKDVEVTDDFDVVGSIGRLLITGNGCLSCPSPQVLGVYVRFWSWTPAGPGALLQESFLPADDPDFLYDSAQPDLLDITLPVPFDAGGKHFVSVQLALGDWGIWGWWLSNQSAPSGSPLLVRDAAAGNSWGPFVDVLGNELMADAAFQLWSGDITPPDPGSDPCGDWIEIPAPNPAGFIDVFVRDLTVIAAHDAWAVGDASRSAAGSIDHFTFTMHWDGLAWSEVASPSPALFPGPGGTDADLRAVDASGPDDVWAAGSFRTQNLAGFAGTQILVLHWDGVRWTQVAAPNSQVGSGNFVSAVEVVSEDDVWFVGDWLAQDPTGGAPIKAALAMHWDGSGFTIHETPYPVVGSNGYGLIDIDANSADDIWAVGGGHDGDMAALTTYIVHWDGSSWTHVPANPPGILNALYSVEAIGPDDVWVSGSYFDGVNGFPLLLHRDGAGWTEVDAPVAGALLHEVAPGEMYAMSGRRIFRDDGLGWTQVMDFSSLSGVGLGAIASAGGDCGSLWVAGVESVVGEGQPFTARLVPNASIVDLGFGLAGTHGIPLQTVTGPLAGNETQTFAVTGSLENAPVFWIIGLSTWYASLAGGTLVPSFDVFLSGLASDSNGELHIQGLWPFGVPSDTDFYFQFWILDPAGPKGLAATNAVQATTR